MNFLSKHYCVLCNELTKRSIDLCIACEKGLPFLKNYCQRCAEPLPLEQKKCGSCLNDLPLDINTFVLFHYDWPIDQSIIDLKFKNNLVNAKVLGEVLSVYLPNHYQDRIKPEIIVPVPLHCSRLQERGYNQALELAKPIAKKLKTPIDKFSVKRVKNTLPQMGLSAKKRRDNIKKAFSVDKKCFNYKEVAIIDDVITTGNTVFELCRVFQKSGVKKVDIWCLAKRGAWN